MLKKVRKRGGIKMHSNVEMMRRLQIALNSRGMKVLCNRSQFYSEQQNRPVTMYKVAQSIPLPNGKNTHKTLFESASQIQIVLFMRNLWYALNGKEIPPTNNMKGADKFNQAWEAFEIEGLSDFLEMSNNNKEDV